MPVGPLCGLAGFDATAKGFACIDGMNCKVSESEEKQQITHHYVSHSAIITTFTPGKTL
jgi:hypothetical protein